MQKHTESCRGEECLRFMELFNYPAKSGDWTYPDFPGVLGFLASLGVRTRLSVLEQVRIWDRQECMSMTVISIQVLGCCAACCER